jgi:hypothetical protein
MDRKRTFSILLRVAICMLIGVAGGWLISEGSYQLNKNPGTRDEPQRVELVIPAGTSAKLAKGEVVSDIPAKMTFVEGDLLVVRNQDSVSHQLGPVWVPPQSSGVLQIQEANTYSYACTFEASKVLGLDVLPRLTLASRVQGVLAVALPSTVMLALYSFLVFPLKPSDPVIEAHSLAPRPGL